MAEAEDQLGILLPGRSILNPDERSGEPGSHIAAVGCYRALLQERANTAIHLFVREHEMSPMQNDLNMLKSIEPTNASVCLSPIASIPHTLQSQRFMALHNLASPSLDNLAYARTFVRDRVFPITCMEYGFSYQQFLRDAVLRLLLVPTRACDSLICASNVAKQATDTILGRLTEGLTCNFNVSARERFRTDVIPHGVRTDIFIPRDKSATRTQLELPQDAVIILYLGRLDPGSKSDVTPLFLALQAVINKAGGNVRLLLVGPILEHVKKHLDTVSAELGLAPNIIYRNDVPRISLPLYYSAADIFVSLSDTLQENFGLTPLEAMASGLPAVVSDWAGYRELVVHNETGFKLSTRWIRCDDDLCPLAPFYDWTSDHFYTGQSISVSIEELTEYLLILVRQRDLRLRMAERARQYVLQYYTWQRCVGLFWDLWHELDGIARTLSPEESSFSSLLCPRYFSDFSGFASSTGNEMRLKISERGRRVCSKKEKLSILSEPRGLLQPTTAMKILRFIRFHSAIGIAPSLDQIATLASRKNETTESNIKRHVMWLLKYDLVKITNSTAGSQSL